MTQKIYVQNNKRHRKNKVHFYYTWHSNNNTNNSKNGRNTKWENENCKTKFMWTQELIWVELWSAEKEEYQPTMRVLFILSFQSVEYDWEVSSLALTCKTHKVQSVYVYKYLSWLLTKQHSGMDTEVRLHWELPIAYSINVVIEILFLNLYRI